MSSLPGNAVPHPQLVPCPIAEVGDARVPSLSPPPCPPPLLQKQGCVFAEPLFGISKGGGNTGSGPPGWERSASLRGTAGSLNALKSCSAPGQDQARPAPQRGLSGQAFMEMRTSAPGGGRPLCPLSFGVSWWLSCWLGGVTSRGGGGKEAVGTGPRGEGRGCSVGLGLWGGEGIVG